MNDTKPTDDHTKGRPSIKESKLTPAEAQQRHRDKLKANGQKIVQVKIKEPNQVEVLQRIREAEGLKTDTAAANWVMSNALTKYGESY